MSSPRRTSSVPKGAQHLTQLRDQERKKKPIFRFIEGRKGGRRRGAIKCFCFIYKERNFQEAPSEGGGGHLSPNYEQQQAKLRRGEGNWRGQGTPNTPSDRSHELSPPTLNASTLGDPTGMRKGVCTQVGVALGWVGKGITYPQQRWVARGQGTVEWWQWWPRGPVLS